MLPIDPCTQLAPEDRRAEVARLLAIGLLRLRNTPVPVVDPGSSAPTKNLPDSSESSLEVPAETVLSVHTG